ncbi:TetR/AcrR family transcriptional regulator [Clostridioides mangenotii]|uniref:TetR/AcrR family transcriptional regulator n=1 Tax=Metaclostridioides mangenotii TaxID=1540 RepID=UPI00214A56CD|nr:TetR/AcrR family transcriptional regulator [Clostridioides mangenotii]MCR1953996.1 TetR/AcrR family transcriptional regulator [Clostridioides mangenotii]
MSDWIDYIINDNSKDGKLTKKQQNILIAAIELISEKGYEKVSTAEIAQRAGVAEGSIFRQYKTKKGLLDAVVFPSFMRFMAPKFFKEFSESVLNKEYVTFEMFVRAIVDDRFKFAKKETPLLKILVNEFMSQKHVRDEIESLFYKYGYNKIESTFDKFIEKGETIDIPTMTAFRIIITNVLGYFIPRFILYPNLEWDDKAEKDMVVKTIVKTLKPL